MKKRIAALMLLIVTIAARGQMMDMPPIPVDPEVRIGVLENGLTYYIRHNGLPENQADFYIAQKVGSILEEDDQRGLAHFLEHICFNGTEHFPGNSLRTYLESVGVKFGANLNAYTSIDETVYNITNVPVTKEGVVDSCLMILHDWADALTLDPEEIDKERGVIHEEWRTSTGAMMRMFETVFPIIFKDSKYAYRLPIGTMEVVDNFPYQTLRDFYEKWYRPDLQGIIVVGDIDVDEIEGKIKDLFGPIEMPSDAAEREYFPVPDNVEPLIAIASDKEQQTLQAYLLYKHDPFPEEQKSSMEYIVVNYMLSMIERMIGARLDELTQTADPPYLGAAAGDGDFILAKTKAAFAGIVASKDDGFGRAFSSLLREIQRAKRFGFTQGEYERARADYLSGLEQAYNERDKMKNHQFVSQYVSNFLNKEPIPSIEQEYGIMSELAPVLPVDALNGLFSKMIEDENIAVCVFCPEKEGFTPPTEEEVRQLLEAAVSEELEPYVDNVSDEPLIETEPEGGHVTSTEEGIYGSTVLTLSNGVRVVIKPTDYKADEILLTSFSNGGKSVFSDEDIIQFKYIDRIIGLGGLGNFSAIDLQKVLAGKIASATASVRGLTEAVNGECAPKDFETMMQLTYLSFTAPRKDEDAFASFKTRMKAQLANLDANPNVAFSDSITKALYGDNPRAIRIQVEDVERIDYDRVIELYKNRFEDASDFTFFLTGNIDIEQATPMIEKYLGALPSTGREETFSDKTPVRKGSYKNIFTKELETAMASEFILLSGDVSYNMKNKIMVSMATQLLDMEYTQTVREDAGGTYGVQVSGDINKYPTEDGSIQIYFTTDPARREEMVSLIEKGINDFIEKGPKEESLQMVKEYMLKKHAQNLKENRYWIGILYDYYWEGYDGETGYEETVNEVSAADLQAFAKEFFSQGNEIEVGMTVESEE